MSNTTAPQKLNGHATPGAGPQIRLVPDEPENKTILKDFWRMVNKEQEDRRAAVGLATPALARLCCAMRQNTGQSYKLRALLYSLWNGQPTSLLEIVTLDHALRDDLCAVLRAFGHEDREVQFYYDAIKAALVSEGIFNWFLEAEGEVAK